jgi:hypothetical protein
MRAARASSVTAALIVLRSAFVHAAPPSNDASDEDAGHATEDGVPEAEAGLQPAGGEGDDDPLTRVRKLFALGAAKFDLGDCAGAIEAWEEAYEGSPLELRGQLQVPLANAHVCQYEADGDPDHMRRAEVLYRDYLEALDADDEETRAQTEAMLTDVRAELDRVEAEAKARERELAEREARAREEAAREIVAQQLQNLDPYTEEERRRFRRMTGLGGALLAAGAGSAGVMVVALALGQRVDKRGAALTPGDPYSKYAALRDEGRAWNATATATGIVGGALLASGAAVLIVALLERERARQSISEAARLRPRLTGLELQF